MKRPRLLRCSLAAAYFATIAWLVVTAATWPSHPLLRIAGTVPFGDKLGHFFLMGMLVLVLNYFLRGRALRAGPFSVLIGTAVGAALVVMEELSQQWLPFRTFSGADLLADALGVLAFDALSRWCIGVLVVGPRTDVVT